jgi:hypothetical protein
MLVTHAGSLAEVFKQIVLADVFVAQRPAEYWESHAQPALVPGDTDTQHGMGRFIAAAASNVALSRTPLHLFIGPLRQEGGLSQQPSSSWLAMKTLGANARRFLFCGTDADSLQSIQTERRALGVIETKVECIQDDGVMLLRGACMVLSDQWTSSTLAFIDSPDIDTSTDAGISPLQLWCEIANRGIPTLLAYTFSDAAQRTALHGRIADAIQQARLTGRNLHRFEGALVQPPVTAPPIPWGFGLLTANLGNHAIFAADRDLFALQAAYAGSVLEGWGDGMWKYAGERC